MDVGQEADTLSSRSILKTPEISPYVLDQSTLQIINVARRRDRLKLRRVFLLRAIEGLAFVTS